MSSRRPTSPIRVVLRVADGPSPAFLLAAADAVLRVAGAEVVLIIVANPVHERPSTFGRLGDRIDAIYDWLERIALYRGPAALAPRRRGPFPEGVVVVRDADRAAQVDAMRMADADVLIDLAPEAPSGPLPVPPAGWWQVRYAIGIGGARHPNLAGPSAPDGLAESLLSVDLGAGEHYETGIGVGALRRIGGSSDRDAMYWRAALLPARRLARLVAGDTVPCDGLDARAAESPDPPVVELHARTHPPFVRLGATIAGKVVERILFRTGWSVMIRQREPDREIPRDLSGFEPIDAPAGRFYADPFVVTTPDGPRLYVEDCPHGAHRGRISALQKGADGRWGLERVVLEDRAHRAYPHALRTDVGLLVTPDGGRSGGVDLFIDHGPDDGLERVGRCLEGVPASDPTLLWHEGRYWLFVTVTGHGMNPWDELHLYSSASIHGMWQAHPRNPVVADARCARPAGRIFRRGDQLIRPGQDCSVAYGRRIVLSAITKLTPDEYEEHPIGSIEPIGLQGVQRTHTYTFDGSIEALDGYRRVRRWPGRTRTAR